MIFSEQTNWLTFLLKWHSTEHWILQDVWLAAKNCEIWIKRTSKMNCNHKVLPKLNAWRGERMGSWYLPIQTYWPLIVQTYPLRSKLVSWFVTLKFTFQIHNVVLIVKNTVTTKDSARMKQNVQNVDRLDMTIMNVTTKQNVPIVMAIIQHMWEVALNGRSKRKSSKWSIKRIFHFMKPGNKLKDLWLTHLKTHMLLCQNLINGPVTSKLQTLSKLKKNSWLTPLIPYWKGLMLSKLKSQYKTNHPPVLPLNYVK